MRQKYRIRGAARATTTIGTTIAGIKVLRGMPLDDAEELCDGGAVCTEVGDEGVVDDVEVVNIGGAEATAACVNVTSDIIVWVLIARPS